jgi:hypothetical protein
MGLENPGGTRYHRLIVSAGPVGQAIQRPASVVSDVLVWGSQIGVLTNWPTGVRFSRFKTSSSTGVGAGGYSRRMSS